jgi:phage/plasmid primase-like uncharacterized protein
MTRWTNLQIDCARAQPIEDECARRGIRLKRVSAAERVGPCPLCDGTDRFSINIRKQVWNCRECRKGGDVIDLVRHVDGIGFNDTMELLTGERGDSFDRAAEPPDMARLANKRAEAEEAERRHRAVQLRKALWLWKRRRPVTGTLAEIYLVRRGYRSPAPGTLGFLPASGECMRSNMISPSYVGGR